MQIKGIVEEIIYRNIENNYTVICLNVNGEFVTAVGKFPPISEGEEVEVTGEFSKHSKYGEQFNIKNIKITPPTSKEGIIRYLSSGLLKGVGPVTAENIVNKFGEKTLEIMEFSPSRLVEIRGISEKKAIEIAENFSAIKNMQAAVLFLQQYNISTNLAIKIYNHYGSKTENVLKQNPYKLVEDIEGVGFFTADKIAQNMGIEINSEFRLRAGLLHTLKENSDKSGNTFIYQPNLQENVSTLLRQDIEDDAMENILQKLTLEGQIKVILHEDKKCVMLSKYYNIEKIVATTLQLLSGWVETKDLDVSDEIKMYELLNKISMHEKQKDAVKVAINNGVSIITGGPGTGKTTIIKCIMQIYKNMRKKVCLMAPTGRAAKRLNESTGYEAMTIHRALELDFNSNNMFFYNNLNKLPFDVIIVDEVSMVDIQLAYYLVRALKRGTRLLFVGDKDQLASVGAGNVLADMLESNQFATVCLTHIYRQSNNSLIISNAHEINNGKMPVFNNSSTDFFFVEKTQSEEVLNTIIDMCTTRIPKFLNCDISKIQVLAPMKAGVCGIDNINKALQEKINPPSLKKVELVTEKIIYRVGDRIMQISNNYERVWKKENNETGTGVFNGDIGIIADIEINTGELQIEFEDGRKATYLKSDLQELVLSYAITIHKSQGSEFDVVIIPVLSGPPMLLTRNLLYTAITRAKKMVVLIGTKSCIARMVKNNYTQVRYTLLKKFLCDTAVYGQLLGNNPEEQLLGNNPKNQME